MRLWPLPTETERKPPLFDRDPPDFFCGDGHTSEAERPTLRVEKYASDPDGLLRRTVRRRDGSEITSTVERFGRNIEDHAGDDLASAFDYSWLRAPRWPPTASASGAAVRIVDLFCGIGGMTLGVAEACRALSLPVATVYGVDTDAKALGVYGRNFETVLPVERSVMRYLDGKLGAPLSDNERRVRRWTERGGGVDLLLGGPPCQGHSSLNNRTRRSDPKNLLYLRMARAAEVFRPEHVLIENVVGVQQDDQGVFEETKKCLEGLEYHVSDVLLRGENFGVPQTRARVFMVATRREDFPDRDGLRARYGRHPRTFFWACGDLVDVDSESPLDRPSVPHPVTEKRIDYLFEHDEYELPDELRPPCHRDKDHTYGSVYGRIRGEEPSPTITTGYTTMGQGRFVHPIRKRTITPHEAARIQFFPDYFDLGEDLNREAHKRLIGNAVPPKLAYVLALELLR